MYFLIGLKKHIIKRSWSTHKKNMIRSKPECRHDLKHQHQTKRSATKQSKNQAKSSKIPSVSSSIHRLHLIRLCNTLRRDMLVFLDRTFSAGSVMDALMTVHSIFSLFRIGKRGRSSSTGLLLAHMQNRMVLWT